MAKVFSTSEAIADQSLPNPQSFWGQTIPKYAFLNHADITRLQAATLSLSTSGLKENLALIVRNISTPSLIEYDWVYLLKNGYHSALEKNPDTALFYISKESFDSLSNGGIEISDGLAATLYLDGIYPYALFFFVTLALSIPQENDGGNTAIKVPTPSSPPPPPSQ